MAYAVFAIVLFLGGGILGFIVRGRMGVGEAERARRVEADYRELGERQSDIMDTVGRADENIRVIQGTVETMDEKIQRARDILDGVQKRNRPDNKGDE